MLYYGSIPILYKAILQSQIGEGIFMCTEIFDRLVIFEMANNHSGDVEHGKALIRRYAGIAAKFPEFRCAIKFQYRDIPTFIHPDFQQRFDLKYVKRFSETALPSPRVPAYWSAMSDRLRKNIPLMPILQHPNRPKNGSKPPGRPVQCAA